MKKPLAKATARALCAVLLSIFMFAISFAGTAPIDVAVTNLTELADALSDAAASGSATTISFAAGTVIDIGGASASIPSNVTINLMGGTLRVSGGSLSVSGAMSGGAVEIVGGTLLRQSGGNITASITTGSGGVVRGPMMLTLENLDIASGETITSLSYAGESGSDTSGYVTRNASAVLYTQMTGSNYSVYKTVTQVATSTGNVFRLGTRNTSTLSLLYTLSYSGLTGAKLRTLNPTSYTASDEPITLVNPSKDGFTFGGWICEALGVTVPNDKLAIPTGTTGDLSFTAVWTEGTTAGGKSGSLSSSGASGTNADTAADAESAQNAAAAENAASTTTKRVKQASASTKVTFTDKTNPVLPTLESIEAPSSSFPWGLAFGGLAALGILAYALAKYAERKKQR